MSRWSVTAAELFDGRQWRGPATVVIEGATVVEVVAGVAERADTHGRIVLPGLVDWGVSAAGYAESPLTPHPFAAEAAFAAMCLRYGVTTVVDVNNAPATLAFLVREADEGRAPQVLHAGGRLATEPATRHDIVIQPKSVGDVLEAAHRYGAELVSLGLVTDAAMAKEVSRLVGERGETLVLSRQYPRETPGLVFAPSGALPPVAGFVPDADSESPDAACYYYAPQLEASSRWSVDGLLAAHDAALAAPFLPYTRNFARNSGFIGRRIGRAILERYYGDRDQAALGVDRAERAREHLHAGTCLAASGVGAAGLVPGLSLWAEIEKLQAITGASADALHAASGVAASLAPARRFGTIQPGSRADLLVCADGSPGQQVAVLRETMTHVVLAGAVLDVARMSADVDAMIASALKEPL